MQGHWQTIGLYIDENTAGGTGGETWMCVRWREGAKEMTLMQKWCHGDADLLELTGGGFIERTVVRDLQATIWLPVDDDYSHVFKTLVGATISDRILSLSHPGIPYSGGTDACDHQLGAPFFQTYHDEGRKPLGFLTLLHAEKDYFLPEKECIAAL